jgi:N-acetyl-gamma-glutamyl-phosphate reductase
MVRCAVVGASGYAGAQLVELLAQHPDAEIVSLHADGSAGTAWHDAFPGRRHLFRCEIEAFDADRLAGLDVVFLAQPHGTAARSAAALHRRVGVVVDLSGDLRLPDAASYRAWYSAEHPAPHLLGRATYGLPEVSRAPLLGADLIACAGCYATVAQIAAAPFVAALASGAGGATDGGPVAVTISAMSGTTGAGRKPDVALSFSDVSGNLRAYRVGRHQHAPEIALGLSRHAGHAVVVTFVPHLVPIARGILATVVVANPRGLSQGAVAALYASAYAARPFARIADAARRLPEVADVVGTNFCDVAPVVDEAAGTIVVIGVIDNLMKGAAGQAVQAMNLALGLPETAGLLPPRAVACATT